MSQELEKLGIPANDEDVLLSTHDLLSWLKRNNISKTWLVGTEGMRDMLERNRVSRPIVAIHNMWFLVMILK